MSSMHKQRPYSTFSHLALIKYCPNSFVTGIYFQFKGKFEVRISPNRLFTQSLLKGDKCLIGVYFVRCFTSLDASATKVCSGPAILGNLGTERR